MALLLAGLCCRSVLAAPTISLITIGPGPDYWSRFGHNALMVEQPGQPPVAYNFGYFNFSQENFFLNFIRGRMLYQALATDPVAELDYYYRSGRSASISVLDLEPSQAEVLVTHLENHVLPGNDEYLYDYFRNNCSTKIRDALDLALGGDIQQSFGSIPSANGNYRDHTNRLTQPEPWLYLGTHLGLGKLVDQPISRWDEFFIPMELAAGLAHFQVKNADGARPLIKSTRVVEPADPIVEPAHAPVWWPWFLTAGLLIAMAFWAGRQRTWPLVFWLAITGLIGLVLLGLWALTDHEAAYANTNLLVFSPLGIALLAMIRSRNRPIFGWILGLLLLGILAGWGWLLVADHPQQNLEFLLLTSPAWLVIAASHWCQTPRSAMAAD